MGLYCGFWREKGHYGLNRMAGAKRHYIREYVKRIKGKMLCRVNPEAENGDMGR